MKKVLILMLTVLLAFSCLTTVSAATNDFVPSIQIKPGPSIVVDDEIGYQIEMPDGTIIKVPVSEIIITPIADADKADEHIRKALEESYDELKKADSLDELIEKLQEILDKNVNGVKVKDLVISDLFHVYVTGEYVKYLDEGGKLKLTFKLNDKIILGMSDIDGKWSALIGDDLIDNGDGSYSLYVGDIGVYAFVKDTATVEVDPEKPGVSSPTTGDFTYIYWMMGCAFVLIAGVFFALSKKQEA